MRFGIIACGAFGQKSQTDHLRPSDALAHEYLEVQHDVQSVAQQNSTFFPPKVKCAVSLVCESEQDESVFVPLQNVCEQNTHSYSMYRCAQCVRTSHCTV